MPAGIERVLINTHHLPGPVKDFADASPWRGRITLVHEQQLLGTGGTLLRNMGFFDHEAFLVAHADNLTDFDAAAFLRRHRNRPPNAAITMMTFRTDAPIECGIVEQDGEGIVKAFHEKVPHPPGDIANAAVYVFEPEVLDFLRSLRKDFIDLSTEVIPRFLGRICTFHNDGYHRDIGTPASLTKAQAEFPQRSRS
jgi:mannose-1-phosphate guanylyltransferase